MSRRRWIESVPTDLLDSRIFRFDVELPAVFEKLCEKCNHILSDRYQTCPACSGPLIRQNKRLSVDLLADVSLDYNTVESCLDDIPSQYAFWAAVYAECKLKCNILERAVKSCRGKVYDELVQAQREEKVKISVDAAKMIVEKDERVNKAESELALCNMVASKLYYMIDAIKMKAELGRSLNSTKRTEMRES